jgi:hypothetical protein
MSHDLLEKQAIGYLQALWANVFGLQPQSSSLRH